MLRGSIPERRLKDQNSELAITYASAGRTSTELIEYGVSPGLLTLVQASRSCSLRLYICLVKRLVGHG